MFSAKVVCKQTPAHCVYRICVEFLSDLQPHCQLRGRFSSPIVRDGHSCVAMPSWFYIAVVRPIYIELWWRFVRWRTGIHRIGLSLSCINYYTRLFCSIYCVGRWPISQRQRQYLHMDEEHKLERCEYICLYFLLASSHMPRYARHTTANYIWYI